MSKVTSKLQLTVPKAVAQKHGIRPGDHVAFESAGDVIRVVPAKREPGSEGGAELEMRLRLFDQARKRQQRRNAEYRRHFKSSKSRSTDRGWKREDLYTRGRSR